MNKTLTALATAATLTVAAVATPTTAEARRGWWGPAIVGGFAAAALAGAFARPYSMRPVRRTTTLRHPPIMAACGGAADIACGSADHRIQ